jgi:putative FmdB family regulatory protein
MPLYEYRCPECDAITEKERKMADRKKPVPCEKCGAKAKLIPSRCDVALVGECWSRDGFQSKTVR